MASVFKRKYTRVVNGRKVKKQSVCWHIKYRDIEGIEQRVKGFKDKEATRQLAAKLEREAELGRAGVVDRYKEHRTRPLKEHLEDFRQSLLAKGNTVKHADLTFSRAQAVVNGCRFVMWNDISASRVEQFLAGLRDGDDVSNATSNYYLQSTKQFCRWMVQDGRASESPLQHLSKRKTDSTRQRALGPDELRRLLETTQEATNRFNMAGPERAILYRLAAESGLRANELRSLKVSSFDLESHTVTVTGASAKNRRECTLPLRADTTATLAKLLANRTPEARAFHLPSKYNMAKMLRADLEDAEIQCSDNVNSENYINFHSLRHTTGTLLAASGAHPKVAQAIMRHSDINLTMSRYTHTLTGQEASAIENLPDLSLPSSESQRAVATGTEGSEKLTPQLTPQLTPTAFSACSQLATNDAATKPEPDKRTNHKALKRQQLDTASHRVTPVVTSRKGLIRLMRRFCCVGRRFGV